jgi:YfiH family protein
MMRTQAAGSLSQRLQEAGLDWIVPDWPAPTRVRAFSTTRNGERGAPFDLPRDARTRNAEELRRWLPADPLWLDQVHGRGVFDADATDGTRRSRQADAAVTRRARIVCAVVTADCVPVLLTDRAGSVVAAVHAGWRGLAAGVLEATLAVMRVDPGEVLGWLGPAIGPRAFEVGADVLAAHGATDPGAGACFAPLRPGKWLGDLYGLARRRLARAGVDAVYGGERCTLTETTVFHSYRRDGTAAGRMASMIWREEA